MKEFFLIKTILLMSLFTSCTNKEVAKKETIPPQSSIPKPVSQGHYKEQLTPWGRIKNPIPNPTSQAVGGYANGCQLKAMALPEKGEGYHDIRRERNRFYGQPESIAMVQYIGRNLAKKYNEDILIGDLSQPAGGLMSYAHMSHQNGLDIDIYFATTPKNTSPDPFYENPDNEPQYELADRAAGVMHKGRFKPIYRDALYLAATHPKTARIFVNSVIKLHLCQTEADTSWLRKIRPWGGHNSHFHIRLQCEGDLCSNQNPIPAGDGCNEELEQWVFNQSDAILNPKPQKKSTKPRAEKIPPILCQNILTQYGDKND